MTEIFSEVHAEVRKVFSYNGIILGGEFSYYFKFFFLQAEPGGIFRIGIDYGCNVSRGEHLAKLCLQAPCPPVMIDVERTPSQAEDLELRLLDGESGIYEKHFILTRAAAATGGESAERPLHRSGSRHAGTRRYVYVYE